MKTLNDILLFVAWRIKIALSGNHVKRYWIVSDFKPETNYISDIDYNRADTLKALFRITKAINNDSLRTVIGYEADLC